ncbi:hypothetical protein ACIQU7_23635 [Streptomyces albidoflavus]
MTIHRSPWAPLREIGGLCLVSSGVFGALAALTTVHWTLGPAAVFASVAVLSVQIKPRTEAGRRLARFSQIAVSVVGYCSLLAIAFRLSAPIGWLGVSISSVAVGLWLASEEHGSEGA